MFFAEGVLPLASPLTGKLPATPAIPSASALSPDAHAAHQSRLPVEAVPFLRHNWRNAAICSIRAEKLFHAIRSAVIFSAVTAE
jgi:hypothetical protein